MSDSTEEISYLKLSEIDGIPNGINFLNIIIDQDLLYITIFRRNNRLGSSKMGFLICIFYPLKLFAEMSEKVL